MIRANVAEVKAKLSYYLRIVKNGETVQICERNRPIAELVTLSRQVDRELRESAFGMYEGTVSAQHIIEALRPMSDEEADDFVMGRK